MVTAGTITKKELTDVLVAVGDEDAVRTAEVIFFYVTMNRLTEGFLEELGKVSYR